MEVSALLQSLLIKRGIDSPDGVANFLAPDFERHTHDPFLMPHMAIAVARLFRALEAGERIAIYADFDCDGIPGAALLSDFFKKIQYDNIEVYLPHRDREGYGFHTAAIDELKSRGVSLIITVDVGTVAFSGVAHANGLGIDVIVTDHHELQEKLPEAVAILNPKMSPYPFSELCGSGVAFKFVQAALLEGRRLMLPSFLSIPAGWEKWLLDLVAIATIADMVPLVGENRAFTHFGLRVLRKSSRIGINTLCLKLRVRKTDLTEDDVAFLIAPRINAASRMDEPDLALTLLTTKDPAIAHTIVATLEKLNASRKGIVASLVKEARVTIEGRYTSEDRVVVAGSPEWKPALLGLVANSIMMERGGVVCVWGRDANGNLKGSCRSDGAVSLPELFAKAGDVFIESGGHEKSGGFSVSHEQVHRLGDALHDAAQSLLREDEKKSRESDASVLLPEISRALLQEVSQLAPFGIGNPKPLFLIDQCIVTSVKRFGKQSNHIELMLEDRSTGTVLRAYDFFRAPENFLHAPRSGAQARVLATIERDSYRGGLALRLVDIVSMAEG
jgi:single-stranded-DNA-specific exonuclease